MKRRDFFGVMAVAAWAFGRPEKKPSCKRDLAAEKRLRQEMEIDFEDHGQHRHAMHNIADGTILVRAGKDGLPEYVMWPGMVFCDGRHGTPDLRARFDHTHRMPVFDEVRI